MRNDPRVAPRFIPQTWRVGVGNLVVAFVGAVDVLWTIVPLLAVPLLVVPLLVVPLLEVPLLEVPLLEVPLLAVPLLEVPLLVVGLVGGGTVLANRITPML